MAEAFRDEMVEEKGPDTNSTDSGPHPLTPVDPTCMSNEPSEVDQVMSKDSNSGALDASEMSKENSGAKDEDHEEASAVVYEEEKADEKAVGVDPEAVPNLKTLSQEEIKVMFKNPRDRAILGKKRLRTRVEKPVGNSKSWHRITEKDAPFVGKLVPYGNRGIGTSKVGNDLKTIKGELRGEVHDGKLRLLQENKEEEVVLERDHNGKVRKCPFCDHKILRYKYCQIAFHFFQHHDYVWSNYAFVCDICEFVTFTLAKIQTHLGDFHSCRRSPLKELCHECGKTFQSVFKLKAHRMICPRREAEEDLSDAQKKVYSHACQTCGESFSTAASVENHMSKVHGTPYRFPCTEKECNFRTNLRHSLIQHLFSAHKVHVGSEPILKCNYCDFVTLRPRTLAHHELRHTAQEYQYKCTHDGCDSSFRTTRHLKLHISKCHIDLKLPCQYCDAVFPTTDKLNRHEKRMHTNRVRNFKCGYCEHATVDRENCRTHIRRSHTGKPLVIIDLKKSGLSPLPV